MKRVRNVFQHVVVSKTRVRAKCNYAIVAGCDVDELLTARSRRLAKCRRRKCRLRFRLLLLCGNSVYTYEEYKVEEAEKVLSALRRATHFRSKFLDCTCNKLICSFNYTVDARLIKIAYFHL